MKKQEHIKKHKKKVTGSTLIAPKEEQYESEKLKTPVSLVKPPHKENKSFTELKKMNQTTIFS